MALRDHLREFRNRLGWAMLIILGGGAFGFIWFGTNLGPIPRLGDIVLGPYCALDLEYRPGGGCRLLQTGPFDAFMIRFKVGVAAGAVLTSPAWMYQVWAFITPGLRSNERKFTLIFVSIASALFAAGAVLAYYVVPKGLQVLVGFGDDVFVTQFRGSEYINFVLVLLLIFGVSFLLPLVVVMLNRVGVLPYDKLKQWRRGIVFGLFVFGAIATPGTDPISMLVLAAAMTVLFELAIQISRVQEKRKLRREGAGVGGLDPDEPTPSEYITGEREQAEDGRAVHTDDVT